MKVNDGTVDPTKQIWKMILILIVTMMLTLMLFLTEFSARLSPALLSQNNQPTQQVDASPTPAYNPKSISTGRQGRFPIILLTTRPPIFVVLGGGQSKLGMP